MGSQLSRGCTLVALVLYSHFSFVSSLLGVAAQYQAKAKRARERKSQEGPPGVLLCYFTFSRVFRIFLLDGKQPRSPTRRLKLHGLGAVPGVCNLANVIAIIDVDCKTVVFRMRLTRP